MKIRYVGEIFENSGYGVAARVNICLLHKMGHQVEIVPVGSSSSSDGNWKFKVMMDLKSNHFDKPDVIICHIYPPGAIEDHIVDGIPLIAYVAWETDMLSSLWAYHLNKYADIVITTCSEMKKVFERSGVDVPVHVIGPTIFEEDIGNINTAPIYSSKELPTGLQNVWKPNRCIFYGIFQWIERKDPEKLIMAYLQEFDRTDEDVCLVLKSYRADHSKEETKAIVNDIKLIHRELNLIYSPEIRLIPERLSDNDIELIHRMGSIYVSPNKGEGTCLPVIDAILHNNYVITTPYGGPSDFTLPSYTRWLDYKMVPIRNKAWCMNYFNCNMKWADVNVEDLMNAMRDAYNMWKENKYIQHTEDAATFLKEQYSMGSNITAMEDILRSIS